MKTQNYCNLTFGIQMCLVKTIVKKPAPGTPGISNIHYIRTKKVDFHS